MQNILNESQVQEKSSLVEEDLKKSDFFINES